MSRARQICINGLFLSRRASGLERFALETVLALDGIVQEGHYVLAIPRGAKLRELRGLKHIRIVKVGIGKGFFWEQIFLPLFAFRRRMDVLGLTNTVPFLRPGVVCLHDVFYMTHADLFRKTIRSRLSAVWHRLQYRHIAKCCRIVFTVSNYSRRQIVEKLNIDTKRLVVLGNGWEHMCRIHANDAIFTRFPTIVRDGYFFVLGNQMPYKNMAWALAAAKRHPSTQWVITGHSYAGISDAECRAANVIWTGYVSDGEMKSLMAHCRALVHPSLDEGFGIPPLEALSQGKEVIAAKSPCLLEIYGSSVHWIENPATYDGVDTEVLLQGECTGRDEVLLLHSWRLVAERIVDSMAPMLLL